MAADSKVQRDGLSAVPRERVLHHEWLEMPMTTRGARPDRTTGPGDAMGVVARTGEYMAHVILEKRHLRECALFF